MIAKYGPQLLEYPDGTAAASITVRVVQHDSNASAVLYQSLLGVKLQHNIAATDANGLLRFYAEPDTYDLLVNGVRIPVVLTAAGSGGIGAIALQEHINDPHPHEAWGADEPDIELIYNSGRI